MTALALWVAVSLPGPTAASAAVTVKGDRAAWAEIAAAYRKLNSLSGYRIKGDISVSGGPGGGTVSGEFAPPNAYHLTQQSPRGTSETFSVGGKIVSRQAEPGCRGRSMRDSAQDPNGSPFFKDPEDFDGEYTITRQPDTTIDGTPVHAYGIVMRAPRGGGQITGTISIGTETGLPRRNVFTIAGVSGQGGGTTGTSTTDFYDLGAKIAIVLPDC
ncbi:MAG TPA: hypothetical protein VKV57_11485 [bacterium]|nr:hypothetical protein [bacterium]